MLDRLVGVRAGAVPSSRDDELDFFPEELLVGWVETGCVFTGADGRPATGLFAGELGFVPCPGFP